MKRILAISLGLLSGVAAFAETSPSYINPGYGVVTNALPIDATSFVNNGTFNLQTSLPYDTSNTKYFTNTGSMFGSVGYQFDRTTTTIPAFRYPAANFYNTGKISGISPQGDSGAVSKVLISATNIQSFGTLEVGSIEWSERGSEPKRVDRG